MSSVCSFFEKFAFDEIDATFEESMEIYLGGVKVDLLYFGPTHSDNLIQVHIPEEGVLIAIDFSRAGRSLVLPDFRDLDVDNAIDVLGILSRLENVDVVLRIELKRSSSRWIKLLKSCRDSPFG